MYRDFSLLIRSLLATTLIFAGLYGTSNLVLAAGKLDAYKRVSQYVAANQAHSMVLSSKGEFIAVFNDKVKPWIEKPLTIDRVQEIRATLASPFGYSLKRSRFCAGSYAHD